MPPPLLPGAPLPAQFPCLFGGAEHAKGYPAFLLAAGSSQLHDLTWYNEEMDRKVNKTCPKLDGKWQLQDSDRGLVGSMHDTQLLPFRSEQTSFLSASQGFPPLQLVLMSFFPLCAMSHRSSHRLTSGPPSGLVCRLDLRRPRFLLVGST